MFVEDVTIESVEEWHTRLAEMITEPGGPKKSKRKTPFVSQPLSAKTRRNAHTRLFAGLALMVRYGHIPMNPAAGLGPPRTRNRKVQALTPEEYTALLEYIPQHWRPFVEALARTGMRFSEVTALTARRVALTHKPPVIYVQEAYKRTDQYAVFEKGATKSEQGMRVVPIDGHLKKILTPLVRGKKPDDEVFTTEWGNTIRHTNFHSRVWRPAVLKARKEHAITFTPTIHDLRHAHATWLLTAGIPVHTTADRLGHDPAVLLREYAHLLDTGRTAAPDTITQLLDKRTKKKTTANRARRKGAR